MAWDVVPSLKLTGIAATPNRNEVRVLNRLFAWWEWAAEQPFVARPLGAR